MNEPGRSHDQLVLPPFVWVLVGKGVASRFGRTPRNKQMKEAAQGGF
jgi:hypothetical protein